MSATCERAHKHQLRAQLKNLNKNFIDFFSEAFHVSVRIFRISILSRCWCWILGFKFCFSWTRDDAGWAFSGSQHSTILALTFDGTEVCTTTNKKVDLERVCQPWTRKSSFSKCEFYIHREWLEAKITQRAYQNNGVAVVRWVFFFQFLSSFLHLHAKVFNVLDSSLPLYSNGKLNFFSVLCFIRFTPPFRLLEKLELRRSIYDTGLSPFFLDGSTRRQTRFLFHPPRAKRAGCSKFTTMNSDIAILTI